MKIITPRKSLSAESENRNLTRKSAEIEGSIPWSRRIKRRKKLALIRSEQNTEHACIHLRTNLWLDLTILTETLSLATYSSSSDPRWVWSSPEESSSTKMISWRSSTGDLIMRFYFIVRSIYDSSVQHGVAIRINDRLCGYKGYIA